MKSVYPVILTPADEGGYIVTVPALDINTEGETITEAIEMAREAIGLWGLCVEDSGSVIPVADNFFPDHQPDDIVTLVDVDFAAFRRANDMRTIRKNVTLPAYLNDAGEKAGINFSQILQEGLKARLGI